MKKKIVAGILMLCTIACLAGCDGLDDVKEVSKGVQDTVSKYSQQIEDSKEVITDGMDKLQGILDEVRSKSSGD